MRPLGWLTRAAANFNHAGLSAYYGSDWKRAAVAWEARLQIERIRGDQTGIAGALYNSGIAQERLGNYPEALRRYEASLKIKPVAVNPADAAMTLHNMGTAHQSLGNYPEALKRYEASLKINRALGNRARVARTLTNIGNVQGSTGHYPEALKRHQDSLNIYRALGIRTGVAGTLNNIGSVHQSLGHYPEALEHYESALAIRRALGDRAGVAGTLNNIGLVQRSLGNYPEALERYEASLEVFRKLGVRAGIATASHNIGLVQSALGNYPVALKLYEAALKIKRKLGDRAGTARSLNAIGGMHLSLGQFSEALSRYEASLKIWRSLGNPDGIAETIHNIGIVQRYRGHYPEALARHEESLKTFRGLGDQVGVASTLHNLGVLQELAGNHIEALRLYGKSLEIERALGNQAGIAGSLNGIGWMQSSLGHYPEAHEAYERALSILDGMTVPETRARIWWGLASLHLRQGQPAKAVAWARKGVGIVSDLAGGLAEGEGAGARDFFSGLFDTGIRAALSDGPAEDLLWFLEQGRAGSLREALGSRASLEAAVLPSELHRALTLARHGERQALETFQEVQKRNKLRTTHSARNAWRAAQAEVERVSARIQREAKAAAAITLTAPDDLTTIQGHLAPTDALVYYALTGAEGVALVVRRDKTRVVALAASKDIEAATAALLDDDLHISPGGVLALSKALVEPLRLNKDVKRVLVSPMGRLSYVPFSLLFPDMDVAYVPSGTTYGLLLEEKDKRGDKILAFGDPDYQTRVEAIALKLRGGNVTGLPRLPATRLEVEAIADVRLLGEQATETGLQGAIGKQKRWRSVHFACHGLVDPARPMLSALALTADEENDGFLRALEVLRMKISADLVVMSACETGKGKIYKTEGIVGLTRAFMFAGAPRVICSLWKVDDEATKALMIKFYQLWNPRDGGKGLGAAAALREAQKFIRRHEKWKHPCYWAAWVLWGLPE